MREEAREVTPDGEAGARAGVLAVGAAGDDTQTAPASHTGLAPGGRIIGRRGQLVPDWIARDALQRSRRPTKVETRPSRAPASARLEVLLDELLDVLERLSTERVTPCLLCPNAGNGGTDRHGATAEPLLIRVEDAARMIGVGRTRMFELVWSNQIPSVRIGRSVRIPRERLLRWIEEHSSDFTGDVDDDRAEDY